MKTSISHPWFLLLVTVTIAATFPFFLGNFPGTSDMRDVYIPLEDFFQKHQKNLQLPAWQPLAAWGFPAIASGQIGFFYPPLLIARQFLPFPAYLSIIIITHILGLAAGTFLLARRYQQSPAAAFLASSTFTYGAFAWQHLTHLNIFLILPWVPWQLWYSHRLHRQQQFTPPQVATFALLLGIPFLVGQFQIPALIAITTLIHFIYLRWPLLKNPWHTTIVPLAMVGVITLALISAQILPTLELLPYSSRNDSSQQFDITRANQYSYPLYHLPTLIFPRFYDTDDNYWGKRLEIEYGFFIGTIPLLLVIFWLWQKKRDHTRQDRFFILLAFVTFLLALGSLSPFRLIGLEPSLWVFSAPARWLLFTSLALCLLAGRAFDSLSFKNSAWHQFVSRATLLLVTGITLANITLFSPLTNSLIHTFLQKAGVNNPYNQQKITSLLQSAQNSSLSFHDFYTYIPLIALISLLLLHKQPPNIQKITILSLTTLELILISSTTVVMKPWSEILKAPPTLQSLPPTTQNQQDRLYSIRENTDSGAYFTNPDSRGGEVENLLRTNLLTPLIHTHFEIAGIEWPASLDFATHEPVLNALRKPDSYELINITAAEHLNIGAVIAPSKLSLPTLESQATAVTIAEQTTIYQLNPTARVTLEDANGQPIGNILSQHISSTGNIDLQVTTDQPAKLVIRDSYYPGWQARINNQLTPIQQEPPFFRSLTVPAGEHSISITYHPQKIYQGTIISALTLLLCLIMITFTKRSANATLSS